MKGLLAFRLGMAVAATLAAGTAFAQGPGMIQGPGPGRPGFGDHRPPWNGRCGAITGGGGTIPRLQKS